MWERVAPWCSCGAEAGRAIPLHNTGAPELCHTKFCLTLHVTFTVLLAGEGVLEAWGCWCKGQSMSQRDLFKLEDAASLPPSLCEQKLLLIGVV